MPPTTCVIIQCRPSVCVLKSLIGLPCPGCLMAVERRIRELVPCLGWNSRQGAARDQAAGSILPPAFLPQRSLSEPCEYSGCVRTRDSISLSHHPRTHTSGPSECLAGALVANGRLSWVCGQLSSEPWSSAVTVHIGLGGPARLALRIFSGSSVGALERDLP